jgi:hypothetical protein
VSIRAPLSGDPNDSYADKYDGARYDSHATDVPLMHQRNQERLPSFDQMFADIPDLSEFHPVQSSRMSSQDRNPETPSLSCYSIISPLSNRSNTYLQPASPRLHQPPYSSIYDSSLSTPKGSSVPPGLERYGNSKSSDTFGYRLPITGPNWVMSQRKRRGNLPREATEILREWFIQHIDSPYPSEDEKQQMAEITSLNMSQVRVRHRPVFLSSAGRG